MNTKPFVYLYSPSRNESWGPFLDLYFMQEVIDDLAVFVLQDDDLEVLTSPRGRLRDVDGGGYCAGCGLTEAENEWNGFGPLFSVLVDIEPGEELQAYTWKTKGFRDPVGVCQDCFVEFQNCLPNWMQKMFAEINDLWSM